MISEKDWDWESNGERDPEKAIRLVAFYEYHTYSCLFRDRFKIDEERALSFFFAFRAMEVRTAYLFNEDDDARVEILCKEYTQSCYKDRMLNNE